MQTVTQRWLDAAKAAQRIESDYALAKLLSVDKGRISNYRGVKAKRMDEDLAYEIAKLAGARPERVIAELHAEKATTPHVRDMWSRMAQRLVVATAGVAILTTVAGAGMLYSPSSAAGDSAARLYIMLTLAGLISGALLSILRGSDFPDVFSFAGCLFRPQPRR